MSSSLFMKHLGQVWSDEKNIQRNMKQERIKGMSRPESIKYLWQVEVDMKEIAKDYEECSV